MNTKIHHNKLLIMISYVNYDLLCLENLLPKVIFYFKRSMIANLILRMRSMIAYLSLRILKFSRLSNNESLLL